MTKFSHGIEVNVVQSPIDQGVSIIQIDTAAYTGKIRVYINDGNPIFDADPDAADGDTRTPTERALAEIGKEWEGYSLGDNAENNLATIRNILEELDEASS